MAFFVLLGHYCTTLLLLNEALRSHGILQESRIGLQCTGSREREWLYVLIYRGSTKSK
uniref:Uncharacterized protein n=1 Tax=Anguilla anguilla TaxID=7936 RepID=A0A0E9T1D4_ANGAN